MLLKFQKNSRKFLNRIRKKKFGGRFINSNKFAFKSFLLHELALNLNSASSPASEIILKQQIKLINQQKHF